MTDSATYVRTAKGRAELAAGTGTLADPLKTVLGRVDEQSTFDDLQGKLGTVPEAELRAALERLIEEGYLERAAPAAAENDLDFTPYLETPGPQPSPEQQANAERQTIGGMRRLKQAGYYVNITSRPGHRIPPNSGEKYHLLIVDGDQADALLLARTLTLADFDVRTASTRGEIVAELGRKPPPDAIVMDTVLPRLNGLDLLARLRQHERFGSVPIIIVTTRTTQQDVVAALARGASGYLTKPFRPEALIESVNAVLGLG